jgi:tetratricopeptide (TPR) repeat protein
MNDKVIASVEKITLLAYPEPPAEEMPMFAENRVHQRTSGNPWPNHVVLKVDRKNKADREYTCIRLENKYLRIEILPELGGRIYSALDKTTGYDFFYKQHVIKPALIGCLGSWVSGGLEFNWPFHHRPSTFMPADYHIERKEDGSAIVWLSEHDPMERMKGMVGVCLKPGEAIFETRVRLANRTPVSSSFLWWENTAVPVNKSYQIFFPRDVSYVNFHYKRSVTTYPIASNATGIFNGIRFDGGTDISLHKNTIQPTSYFSAASKYDFFGGYDHSRRCGVIHVASHHVSSGKKMFTWAYNHLSKSWENALTDTDGQYAELMAGCYSDNQPDFSWIEPYETKNFSQYWFPIGTVGVPVFANVNGAASWDDETLKIQPTKDFPAARIIIKDGEKTVFETTVDLRAGQVAAFACGSKPGCSVDVYCGGLIMGYRHEEAGKLNIPDPISDMPNHKTAKTAQELYLEGVHVWQYRDPAVLPDVYWKEALARDGEHVDSLLALGDFYYKRAEFDKALDHAQRAHDVLTKYNKQPRSGRVFYQLGLVYLRTGDVKKACDMFHKAAWNMDCHSAAMTQIAAIDGRLGNHGDMLKHSANALLYNAENPLATVHNAMASLKLNDIAGATAKIEGILNTDPLNHFARYVHCLCGKKSAAEFHSALGSDPSQTALDVAFDLIACGMEDEAGALLKGVNDKSPIIYYMLEDYENAENAALKSSFPFRLEEYELLKRITRENPGLPMARYYFGCLLYAKGQFEKAAEQFRAAIDGNPGFYIPYRNLAVAYYSHLGKKDEVLPLLAKALALHPGDGQLVFETAHVMGKLGVEPGERIGFVLNNTKGTMRDDICIELARAYNQNGGYEKTLELFKDHTFVPCEGGEHATAEQYMFAHHAIGRGLLGEKKFGEALEAFRKAQVLPQNLGAGLWHEARLVPHQYYEALCLDGLGEKEEAEKLYRHIVCLTVDYFSNMHLPELPYYQAVSHVRMGDGLKGRALMDGCLKKWTKDRNVIDPGYFATTPFFVSYCDGAKEMREAYFSYLLGFVRRFAGENSKEHELFKKSVSLEPYNLWYSLESGTTVC